METKTRAPDANEFCLVLTATLDAGLRAMAGPHPSREPAGWDRLDGVAYCLGCRRKLAEEAKSAWLAEEGSPPEGLRADAEGRIEFELSRSPDRCDTRIARSCG